MATITQTILFQAISKGFERVRAQIRGLAVGFKNAEKSFKTFNSRTVRLGMGLKRLFDSLTKRFQAWALSVLFFGMFIKRTFQGILRTGLNTFTKLMESSNIFTTSIQRLNIYWEYLKFTIGSAIATALEPLVPKIIEIVSAITNWIQEHPKLTATILIFMTVLGNLMLLFGTFFLGIQGILTGFKAFIAVASGLASILEIGLGSAILLIIGAVLALIVVGYLLIKHWKTIEKVAIIVWNFIKSIVLGVWNAILAGLRFVWNTIKPIVTAMGYLFAQVFGFIWEVVKLAWTLIVIGAKWVWNRFVNIFSPVADWFKEHVINPIIDLVNSLWNKVKEVFDKIWNKITSVIDKIGEAIRKVGHFFKKAKEKVRGIREKISGSKQFGGFIPRGGLYRLHGGEYVVPAGGYPPMNVTININGANADPREIARQINEELGRMYRTLRR